MKLYTTLNKIREHSPCEGSWKKLLRALGKRKADDKKLSLSRILKELNIDDAIWALRGVDGHEKEIRLFACDCAESVLKYFEKERPDDKRPRQAIEIARRFAIGKATWEELAAAGAAARAAAGAAAWAAAWDAARAAAWAAAGAAAWAAARDAAWAAARAAAWDAAWAAAWDAEKEYQSKLFKKYLADNQIKEEI